MAGDNAVRSLLEKMTQCASNAYLRILERYILIFNLTVNYDLFCFAAVSHCNLWTKLGNCALIYGSTLV